MNKCFSEQNLVKKTNNTYAEKAVSFCQTTVVYLDKNSLKRLNNCYPPLQNLLRCLLSLLFTGSAFLVTSGLLVGLH